MNTHPSARKIVGFLGLCLAFNGLSLWAQFTSAIAGLVTDPSGAVVPGATVTIKNLGTGASRSLSTTADGYYGFTSLPAAMFNITVAAPGFKTLTHENIQLQVAEVRTVNLALEVGTASTQVTVTSAPLSVELAEARVSGLVDENRVHELPLVGRNFYTLVVLTPGVTGLPSGGGQPYAQANADIFNQEYGVNLNANGLRSESNSFLVDSASVDSPARSGVVNINPNAEDVQELRISVNNFSSEYGHGAAAMVNVVTKQGTNDLHGTASWYHSDNALASRTFVQQPVGPVFRRNEAAWSLGGPIRKDRTFFFGSMDILRSGVGQGFGASVATPQFVSIMSQNKPNNISTKLFTSFPPVANPTHDFRTAGNIAGVNCSTLPSPSTPLPTPAGPIPCNLPVTGTADAVFTLPRNGTQWQVRMDHMFNGSKDRLYGNFIKSDLDELPAASVYPAFRPIHRGQTIDFNLDETHTFSPTVVNEVGLNYVRASGAVLCTHCEIPQIIVIGLAQFGVGGPGTFVTTSYGWRDVLAFAHGSHNLKVGGGMLRPRGNSNFGGILSRPVFIFPNVFLFANDFPVIEGNIAYDPRTGGPAGFSIAIRQWLSNAFVQDDWKVKRNLTITLGMRWESFGNPTQKYNNLANVSFPSGSDFFTRVANARIDPVSAIWNGTDLDNWGPRIGFAWDPTNRGKMSVRGGAGVFYDFPFIQLSSQNELLNPPFFANTTGAIFTPPFLPAYGLCANSTVPFNCPRPSWVKPGLDSKNGLTSGKANISGNPRNFETALSYNWFFGIQRALAANWVVEANYVGSSGHREYGVVDVNRFSGDLIKNNGVLTRLNSSFGQINYAQPQFNSFYSGANVSVRSRASHGLTFQGAYTYGKAIDFLSATSNCCAVVTNLRLSHGLSDFDVRQKFAMSLLWELPRPHFGSATLSKLLGGWEIGDVTILQSGTPYTVSCSAPFSPVRDSTGAIVGNSGCDFNADGNNFDVPNQPSFGNFKGGSRSDYIKGIFGAADFPKPLLGQEGSLGRNTFIGPGFANTDFSVMKNTKIPWIVGKEGANLEFRTEFFNLFNRVNLTGVHGDLADPFFGKSISSFGARDIQFGLRLSF